MPKPTEIKFIVGQLPKWYDEETHDLYLENWLEEVSRAQFDDLESVSVEYVYNGDHFIQGWDQDGDLISETPFDMNGAFDAANKQMI